MLTKIDSLPIIHAPQLQRLDWLVHGFGIKDITIESYAEATGLKNLSIPKTHQPHGNTVLCFRSSVLGPVLEGDAFVTKEPGMVCWVRTADCLPILLADPKNKAVGAVHSGWKGTAEQVVLETVAAMKKSFGTDPKDLIAALGPAIGGRCYQVGVDVAEAFKKTPLYPGPWLEEVDRGHWYLDIAFANLHLLETAGLRKENTYLSLACTSCDLEKFHSFREEKGKKGEQVSFIMVR